MQSITSISRSSYPANRQFVIDCELPQGSKPVSVSFDKEATLSIWAIGPVDAPPEKRRFNVNLTEHQIDPGDNFIGTAIHPEGTAYHIFEAKRADSGHT